MQIVSPRILSRFKISTCQTSDYLHCDAVKHAQLLLVTKTPF